MTPWLRLCFEPFFCRIKTEKTEAKEIKKKKIIIILKLHKLYLSTLFLFLIPSRANNSYKNTNNNNNNNNTNNNKALMFIIPANQM